MYCTRIQNLKNLWHINIFIDYIIFFIPFTVQNFHIFRHSWSDGQSIDASDEVLRMLGHDPFLAVLVGGHNLTILY
jgi:hypothetical protein